MKTDKYFNERYQQSCKRVGSIPRFGSDWSRKMGEWLESKQFCFDGAHEWARWLVDVTEEICESWMDKGKSNTPKIVLIESLDRVKGMLDEDPSVPIIYRRFQRRIRDRVRCWASGTMEERVIRCLTSTWQAIGMDILACGGEDPEQVIMKAEDVRDAVSACGLGKGGYVDSYGDDPKAVEWLSKQSRQKQDELLAEAFPNGAYGA